MRLCIHAALLSFCLACAETAFDLGLPEDLTNAERADGAVEHYDASDEEAPELDTTTFDSCATGADADGLQSGELYEDLAGDPILFLKEPLPSAQDAEGYDASDASTPEWCDGRSTSDELCSTGIDEDCDGRVDEFVGLGEPCSEVCEAAVYACDTSANALVCATNRPECVNLTQVLCGNAQLDRGEACDPFAAGEHFGATCNGKCERPGFVACIEAGREPLPCEGLQVCSRYVGACVPVLTEDSPRCPKIRVEGGGEEDVYPMIEVPGGDPHNDRPMEADQCWITCASGEDCPSVLGECYMGFCVVPM